LNYILNQNHSPLNRKNIFNYIPHGQGNSAWTHQERPFTDIHGQKPILVDLAGVLQEDKDIDYPKASEYNQGH